MIPPALGDLGSDGEAPPTGVEGFVPPGELGYATPVQFIILSTRL